MFGVNSNMFVGNITVSRTPNHIGGIFLSLHKFLRPITYRRVFYHTWVLLGMNVGASVTYV